MDAIASEKSPLKVSKKLLRLLSLGALILSVFFLVCAAFTYDPRFSIASSILGLVFAITNFYFHRKQKSPALG